MDHCKSSGVIIEHNNTINCSKLNGSQNFGAQGNTLAAEFWMCIPLNESWSVALYKLTKIGQFFRGKQPEMQMVGVAWIFDIPLSDLSDSKGCRKAICHNSKTYYIKKVILPPLWKEVYSLIQGLNTFSAIKFKDFSRSFKNHIFKFQGPYLLQWQPFL